MESKQEVHKYNQRDTGEIQLEKARRESKFDPLIEKKKIMTTK
jgi:hypothetical protein